MRSSNCISGNNGHGEKRKPGQARVNEIGPIVNYKINSCLRTFYVG